MRKTRREGSAEEDGEEANAEHSDLLVSIILSESTTSMLNLDLPNLEECADVEEARCIIRPVSAAAVYAQRSAPVLSFILGKPPPLEHNDEITTELAFFSDHFPAESASNIDLDEPDKSQDDWMPDSYFLSDDEIIEPMRRNLNMERVFMKPLVNAKTTAHDSNISISGNDIIVNLNDDDDSSSVCSELICRICHGGESGGDLLKPCRCRGTIALVHIECLEHWLRESPNSFCELCKHHFRVVRQPRYGLIWSIFVYMTGPGEHFRDVVYDVLAFICYTPSAIATTYMLMVICENMAKAHLNRSRNFSAHLVAFCAIFGMAAIDFTYSSWLILTLQRHAIQWRTWYRNNSYLKLILPEHKKKAYTKEALMARRAAATAQQACQESAAGGSGGSGRDDQHDCGSISGD